MAITEADGPLLLRACHCATGGAEHEFDIRHPVHSLYVRAIHTQYSS